MVEPGNSLPANVRDALRGGDKIEAIKRLRETTGLGLKEAKDLIEARTRNDPKQAGREALLASGVPAVVVEAIQRGSILDAVRLLHKHRGVGLKESRDAIDHARANVTDVARAQIDTHHDVPKDTFNRAVNFLWWILALILAGFVAYYFLRGS